jgi:hypothetical protein
VSASDALLHVGGAGGRSLEAIEHFGEHLAEDLRSALAHVDCPITWAAVVAAKVHAAGQTGCLQEPGASIASSAPAARRVAAKVARLPELLTPEG